MHRNSQDIKAEGAAAPTTRLERRMARIRFTNQIPPIDPEGNRIYHSGCDLQARDLLNLAGMDITPIDGGWPSREVARGSFKLLHACLYLEDRLAYQLFRDDLIKAYWRKIAATPEPAK